MSDVSFDTAWMTGDRTLRDRLAALAAFRPVFEQEGFRFAELMPGRDEDGITVLGGYDYCEQAERFIRMAYDYGWVRTLPWPAWRESKRGRYLLLDREGVTQASEDDLVHLITTCIRADRFCDGYLAEAFEAGLILRVTARAEQLLAALPFDPGR